MDSLFNVVDETLAHHIGDADFDASLVHHVLFQDRALLHEGYIGDSSLMFAHIRRADEKNRKPLVLAAVEDGIIVPALKEVGSDPVGEMFSRLKNDYKEEHPIFQSENVSLYRAIFDALNVGIQHGAHPFAWPIGGGFTLWEGNSLIRANFSLKKLSYFAPRQGPHGDHATIHAGRLDPHPLLPQLDEKFFADLPAVRRNQIVE
jgi:hypothetical protein